MTSYWVPNHSTRSFVEQVDVVSGPGYDRMAEVGSPGNRFHDVHRVVSNLGVFSFDTPDHAMKIESVHPGVTVDEVVENTAFELVIPDDVAESRVPTNEELELMDVIDPNGLRHAEVPN